MFFDRLDLLLAHAEVVPYLVDDGLGHAGQYLVIGVSLSFNRLLEDGDTIGKSVAKVPRPGGEWSSLIEAEEGIRRLNAHLSEEQGIRCVFDDDGQIFQLTPKADWQRLHRLFDELLESFPRHRFSRCDRSATLARQRRRRGRVREARVSVRARFGRTGEIAVTR